MKRQSRWIYRLCVAILLLAVPVHSLHAQEIQDNPEARILLEEARRQVVVWDRFPGFTAKLEADRHGKRSGGELTVLPSGKVEVALQDRQISEWAGGVLKSLVNHRLRLETHKHEEAPIGFGPEDRHPQGRLVKKDDRVASTYRIKDRLIYQVNQKNEKGWLSLNVLEYTQTPQGFLPKQVAVFQFDDQGSLSTGTVFADEYIEVEKLWLPKSRVIITAQGGKVETSRLRFYDHRLLPQSNATAPAP